MAENNKGTLIINTIRPHGADDRIPVALQEEIKGGFHQVVSLTDRDNIFEERKTEGMWCYVLEVDKVYKLIGGSWIELTINNEKKTFNQITPSDKWEFTHNMNCYPNVLIMDSEGFKIDTMVQYVSINKIICYFNEPTIGKVSLS